MATSAFRKNHMFLFLVLTLNSTRPSIKNSKLLNCFKSNLANRADYSCVTQGALPSAVLRWISCKNGSKDDTKWDNHTLHGQRWMLRIAICILLTVLCIMQCNVHFIQWDNDSSLPASFDGGLAFASSATLEVYRLESWESLRDWSDRVIRCKIWWRHCRGPASIAYATFIFIVASAKPTYAYAYAQGNCGGFESIIKSMELSWLTMWWFRPEIVLQSWRPPCPVCEASGSNTLMELAASSFLCN